MKYTERVSEYNTGSAALMRKEEEEEEEDLTGPRSSEGSAAVAVFMSIKFQKKRKKRLF